MGRWGNSFFDDDLALDIKAEFDQAVENGGDPATVAAGLLNMETSQEILDEFPEDERDEMFWEESAGFIFAVAVLQLEHNVLQPEAKALALGAIKSEREQGANASRLELLADLEKAMQ